MEVNDGSPTLDCNAIDTKKNFLVNRLGVVALPFVGESQYGFNDPDHRLAWQATKLLDHIMVGSAEFPLL